MSYTQYSQYGGNPYNDASNLEGGRGAQGNYLGQPPIEHEMTNMSSTSQYSNSAAPEMQTRGQTVDSNFFGRVDHTKSQITSVRELISKITRAHIHDIQSTDSSSSAQVEALVTQIQNQNNQIRDSIKYLQSEAANDSSKMQHVKQLQKSFMEQLRAYTDEENAYKEKKREEITRQFKIAYPDASPSEVQQASQMDWGNEGVFKTALKSNRSNQANVALGAVAARSSDIKRIEMTLTELAAMFADMAQIVEAQEPVVQRTEENAIQAQENVDKGNVEIDKANEHARRRNRLKWWCLLVVVLIILAVALGVGLGVGLAAKASKTVTGP